MQETGIRWTSPDEKAASKVDFDKEKEILMEEDRENESFYKKVFVIPMISVDY